MLSAAVKPTEPKLSRREQLKLVSEEADKIWARHQRGELSSDDAVRQLKELQNRYLNLFDRILAL